MKHFRSWMLFGLLFMMQSLLAQNGDVTAIRGLLDRIGGKGTADRIAVVLDQQVANGDKETFVITSLDGKPCIKGSTPLAVTTGINWYLNYYAHVNLAWNQLTTDLSKVTLPVPAQEEKHMCNEPYRYYLNYCTFSYSMSTWTWERWQQEIDWMALHGINMPLQIIGLDVVWYNLLTKDYGYSHDEANQFIAGPCFQAWWGMNNLEGWGGPNPKWWYERQAGLAKKILDRQRELGIEPVLPGYSGMVPSNFTQKTGLNAINQGGWCAFTRPFILDPNSTAFAKVSEKYYTRLKEVMGTSTYYSMDPFHEGANTSGIDVPKAYKAIGNEMLKVNPKAKWVIQQWQWGGHQYAVLDQMRKGQLIVLDLFSDAHTHFGAYKGHDAVYCALSNFGGRTGLFGRLSKVQREYFNEKRANANVKGIGATAEAIEQVPVLYDALYELPWRDKAPNSKQWMEDYTLARYGADNAQAKAAWEKIRNSALNCETGLQGPHEAVLCGRPWWNIGAVSSWGGTGIFYNPQEVANAAYLLMHSGLSGKNYDYDLVDFTRQALTDYGKSLLAAIDQVRNSNKKDYALRRDAYLQLILDLDELLNTNENFMLGRWTQMARGIADEVKGTTQADKEWLELNNARTLITTWGDRNNSEGGGLRDYSYREWGGMMKDFYYKRWKAFFDEVDKGKQHPAWFDMEWAWAHNGKQQYDTKTQGNSAEVAARLFDNYFVNFKVNENQTYHIYRYMETNAMDVVKAKALRGTKFHFGVENLPSNVKATIGVDFNNNGVIEQGETSETLDILIPADAVPGKVLAQLSLTDGTVFKFELTEKDEINAPRTVSVQSANNAEGRVSIQGTNQLSVTHTDEVTIQAQPAAGYDFLYWTDKAGNVVSKANPYTYFGAETAEFTAHFILNKWGMPKLNTNEYNTVRDYKQYLTTIKVGQNGAAEKEIYRTAVCPEHLFQTTSVVDAPKGSEIKVHWKDAGGMNYCRLSAYIDLNVDGDFDDEGEFLKVEGTKNQAGSNMLHDYTLNVRLPYEVPEGVTHLRLRFDGAWETAHLNRHDAMPANAETTRFVYEVPVNITKQAATPCTVTVKTSDAKLGTVDANGQAETYTYQVGEEVVLRCYPSEGYYLKNWTDKYGRPVPKEWMDGNFLRFHAPESNTYTAHFTNVKPGTLAFGDWEVAIEEGDGGLRLNKISQTGTGVLDLTTSKQPVVAVAPTFFHNQSTLAQVILPASLLEMDNLGFQGSYSGDGQEGKQELPQTLKGNRAWTLLLEVEDGGKSFNNWGSCLLATGAKAFDNAYPDGFQLYLKSSDTDLIVKLDGNENVMKKAKGDFSLRMEYDGKENLKVLLTGKDKKTTTLNLKHHLNDISTLSYGLPNGINLKELGIYYKQFNGQPFEGCTALTHIGVEKGHPLWSDVKGVLFNADGSELVLYPAARYTTMAYALKNLQTGEYMMAQPAADKEGQLIANGGNGRERQALSAQKLSAAALWKFAQVEDKNELYHFNAQGYLGGKADGGGAGQVLEVLANPAWAGNYVLAMKQNFDQHLTATVALNLKGEGLGLCNKEQKVALAKTDDKDSTTLWLLTEVDDLTLPVVKDRYTSLALPVGIVAPAAAEATLYQVCGVAGNQLAVEAIAPATRLAPGTGVLVKAKKENLTLALHTAAAEPLPYNILQGALARRTGFGAQSFYLLGEQNGTQVMQLADATTVADNTAYLLATAVPGQPQFIDLSTTTGVENAEMAQPQQVIYDLQGRRVLQITTPGIYIVNGQKQYVK